MPSGDIKSRYYEVSAKDLPLHCPTPSMSLWNAHPRVFLDIAKSGEVVCPYCGTHYKLKGDLPKGHHWRHGYTRIQIEGKVAWMEKTCSFCGNATVAPRLVEYIYHLRGEYMIVTDVPCEECTFCGERYFDALTLRKIEKDFEQVRHGVKTPVSSVTVPVESYALL